MTDRRNPVRAALTDLAMAALKNREMEMAEQIAAVLDRYDATRAADKPRQPRRRIKWQELPLNTEGGGRHEPASVSGPPNGQPVATAGREVSSPTEEQPPAAPRPEGWRSGRYPDAEQPPAELDRRGKK